jgi:LacI family transcriptional regulator
LSLACLRCTLAYETFHAHVAENAMAGERKRAGEARRPTIQDVARLAGVSVGTVSHVLNGRGSVTPERRLHVERAMAELGYQPNKVARSLILQRTKTLAMLIPDVANPFFGELMSGVEEIAWAAGYCVIFGNTRNDPEEELRYLAEFVERRVDGLFIVGAKDSRQIIKALPPRLPVIALDRLPADWPYDAVVVDNRHGIELAVSHVVELGHRRIGFIGGDAEQPTGRERRLGFDEAMARYGLEPTFVSEGAFSLESGRQQAETLFRLPRTRWPSALIAANDLIALGVLAAARAAGIAVPADLSVCGFDDIVYAGLAVPALTSVRQPVREMGAQAVRLLLDRIEGHADTAQTRVLRTTLIVRASTAPPAS